MVHLERHAFGAALRNDFAAFAHRCFLTLNPGASFMANWHIDAIVEAVEMVRRGVTSRLIVNAPPRSLKSIIISVAFPAFLLGHDPRRRIFTISYSAELAAKHATDFLSIVHSKWYRFAFGQMQIARAADGDVYTTRGGYRKSTSVNATLTGLGGDCFIIDDPLKAADAQSDALRNHLNDWFSGTLVSRLDDKTTGAIIVVMQRVHLNDLTGHLLERSKGWTHLSLPAIAESDEKIPIGFGKSYKRRAGEPLHAERESLQTLERIRAEVGSDIFAAQYQQAPVPSGGAMIRRDWLRYYDKPPERTYPARVIQSWDTAAKDGAQNDWSVGTTWVMRDKNFYLLDLVRDRFEYPRLRAKATELAKKYNPLKILIEDASTGTALAQDLRESGVYNVSLVPVDRDKIGRLYVQQAKFEAGLVWFPKAASFLVALEAELLAFPQSKHDDQVDSISQALAFKMGYDSTMSWVSDP
jgi:predicted phage terminase large subunit-like protein